MLVTEESRPRRTLSTRLKLSFTEPIVSLIRNSMATKEETCKKADRGCLFLSTLQHCFFVDFQFSSEPSFLYQLFC
jgi:hypothetical protein